MVSPLSFLAVTSSFVSSSRTRVAYLYSYLELASATSVHVFALPIIPSSTVFVPLNAEGLMSRSAAFLRRPEIIPRILPTLSPPSKPTSIPRRSLIISSVKSLSSRRVLTTFVSVRSALASTSPLRRPPSFVRSALKRLSTVPTSLSRLSIAYDVLTREMGSSLFASESSLNE